MNLRACIFLIFGISIAAALPSSPPKCPSVGRECTRDRDCCPVTGTDIKLCYIGFCES
ncbi:hypothetical protein B0H10DRAFT_1993805 [Mycena sp. CBHHK59/15]|nr:hypothetical protein B0H10DRAFT_1993805 [Mycena sp. CBHHK59/15]